MTYSLHPRLYAGATQRFAAAILLMNFSYTDSGRARNGSASELLKRSSRIFIITSHRSPMPPASP